MLLEPLRFAVIGDGDWAAYMVERYFTKLPTVRLVAIVGEFRTKAEKLAQKAGVPAFDNLATMLEQVQPEAVYVVTPNDTHPPITVTCAAAGVHVFCEKTMATTVDECYEMIEACDRYQVKLTVGQKRKLRPQYAKMGEIIRSGELGAPEAATIQGFHWQEWWGFWKRRAATGGLLNAAGNHDIDTLRSYFGEVATVYAAVSPKFNDDTDYDDAMVLTLQFKNGAIASLQVTCRWPLLIFDDSFDYQIVCERGGIRYDPRTFAVTYQKVDGERKVIQFPDDGLDHAYRLELTNFVEWVRLGTPPILTAESGLRTVEVLQAAYISAATGQPVRLPLPRGLG